MVRRAIDLYYEDRLAEAKQVLASFDPVDEAVKLLNGTNEQERAGGDLLVLIAVLLCIYFGEFGDAVSLLERLLTAVEGKEVPHDFDTATLLVHLRYHVKCDCLKKGSATDAAFDPLYDRLLRVATEIDGRVAAISAKIEQPLGGL